MDPHSCDNEDQQYNTSAFHCGCDNQGLLSLNSLKQSFGAENSDQTSIDHGTIFDALKGPAGSSGFQ